MIYVGKKQAINAYYGTKKVLKMYLGDTEVYVSKLSVSVTIDGVTTNSTIANGDTLSLTLNPASGKQICPWTVVVLMGETDITSTAYNSSDNTISIASVEDAVTITASVVTMAVEYKPVEYIEATSTGIGNSITLPYKPTCETQLYIKFELVESAMSPIFALGAFNGSPSASSPEFSFWARYNATTTTNFGWGAAVRGTSGSSNRLIKTGVLNELTLVPAISNGVLNGKFTYTRKSDSTVYSAWLAGGEWTQDSRNVKFFGHKEGNTTRSTRGKIYEIRLGDNDIVRQHYLPCKRVSDGNPGLYDIENSNYIELTPLGSSGGGYTYPS